MKYELKPNGLYRIFGAKTKYLIREGSAAYFIGESGQREEILVESLKQASGVKKSLLGNKLILETHNGRRISSGLNNSVANDAYTSVSALLYEKLHNEIQPISRSLKTMLMGRYIRTSQLNIARAHAKAALTKFYSAPRAGLIDKEKERDFSWIELIAKMDQQGLENLRDSHIESHLQKFEQFFATVEKDPLTESQRIACITDEDSNLVIAGAGTGKTSTMVGRAGYLVKSGMAKPQEILLLAYANKAAGELRERIQERLGIEGIQVETFHSLGKKIVAHSEGGKPTITDLVDSVRGRPRKLEKWVDKAFRKYLDKPEYRRLVLKYFSELYYTPPKEEDLKTEGDNLRYLSDNNVVTFQGEPVKSYGEVLVANFLYRHAIKYEYEKVYEHPTKTLEYRQYRPDFYLTDYGIYIEFWGTSRDGSTAPWIDRESYTSGMAWKRETHRKYGTHLVDAYHYERLEGTLNDNLKSRLERLGVAFRPMSQMELIEQLSKDKEGSQKSLVNEFTELLTDLLLRIRETGHSQEVLIEKAKSSVFPDQMLAALEIVHPILKSYLKHLSDEDSIDFDHMIHSAWQYVSNSTYSPKWKYLLIDEFQDISKPRAQLIKEIQTRSNNCSIFAVGDDWQAIYRFTGSDIWFTSHFQEYFGPSKLSFLDKTFRFNDQLCDVASSFIQKNPNQVRKDLKTVSKVDNPTIAIHIQTNEPGNENLDSILDHIAVQSPEGAEVLILSRFTFYLPDKSELSILDKKYPNLSFKTMSIHASKGKQADHVILVGAISGTYGLPSEKVTHPMLEALLPKAENYRHAEERRLLYVAITRAKRRAYIVSQASLTSDFVDELIQGDYPLDRQAFPITEEDEHRYSTPCPSCTTGKLTPRTNGTTQEKFYGCSFYPRCRGSANACDSCGMPTLGRGYERRCVNPGCNNTIDSSYKSQTIEYTKAEERVYTPRHGRPAYRAEPKRRAWQEPGKAKSAPPKRKHEKLKPLNPDSLADKTVAVVNAMRSEKLTRTQIEAISSNRQLYDFSEEDIALLDQVLAAGGNQSSSVQSKQHNICPNCHLLDDNCICDRK